jgi:hypothetical protein
MNTSQTRRHFLRSATALIALPALESLGFRRFASAAAAGAGTPPKRLVFLGFGWGITTESWFPDIKTPGAGYELPAQGRILRGPGALQQVFQRGALGQHHVAYGRQPVR